MTLEFQINDGMLARECKSLAKEIFAEVMQDAAPGEDAEFHREEMDERAHQTADGHEWVIYNHKALMMCAHCDVQEGEAFLEEIGMPESPTLDSLAVLIAYGEMRHRILVELEELIGAEEPAEESEED